MAISCYPNAGLPNPLSATGFDLGPAGHGPLSGRLRARRADQHCRRLLRQHARAHRGHRQSARRHASAAVAATRRTPQPSRACRMSVVDGAEAAPPLRIAALHPAARRLHHDRRADQRRRLAQVRQADQGRQIRRSRQRGPPAGRERRQRHRHLHGRGHDRRRRGHDALSAVAGQRARSRQGSLHGRLLEVGGHRGRPEVPAGQGHRQLDLAEGRRREVSPATPPRCSNTARRRW